MHLGQLIYTSFCGQGLRLLASEKIPLDIQEAFIKHVVHQYWDVRNPPKAGYQAAYLRQFTPEHSLFGWVFNDGLGELEQSDVPYFTCYYLTEFLNHSLLETIFICLSRGPQTLISRQSFPTKLETLNNPELSNWPPGQRRMIIPFNVRNHCHVSLKQGRLVNLFVPVHDSGIGIKQNQLSQRLQEVNQPLEDGLVNTGTSESLPSGNESVRAYLKRLTLVAANFSGSHLRQVDLQGTNLEPANPIQGDYQNGGVENTNLRSTKLPETVLHPAALSNPKFIDTNPGGAEQPQSSSLNLVGRDLSRSDLSGMDLREADLRGVNLTGAKLQGADLRKAILNQTCMDFADLREVNLSCAQCIQTSFKDANLWKANLEKAELIKADLSLSNLRKANLTGAHLQDVNLYEADVTEANFSRVSGLSHESMQFTRRNRSEIIAEIAYQFWQFHDRKATFTSRHRIEVAQDQDITTLIISPRSESEIGPTLIAKLVHQPHLYPAGRHNIYILFENYHFQTDWIVFKQIREQIL